MSPTLTPSRRIIASGRLELAENHRDLALYNMAMNSKLRGCDLVRMQVIDIMASGQIKGRVHRSRDGWKIL